VSKAAVKSSKQRAETCPLSAASSRRQSHVFSAVILTIRGLRRWHQVVASQEGLLSGLDSDSRQLSPITSRGMANWGQVYSSLAVWDWDQVHSFSAEDESQLT